MSSSCLRPPAPLHGTLRIMSLPPLPHSPQAGKVEHYKKTPLSELRALENTVTGLKVYLKTQDGQSGPKKWASWMVAKVSRAEARTDEFQNAREYRPALPPGPPPSPDQVRRTFFLLACPHQTHAFTPLCWNAPTPHLSTHLLCVGLPRHTDQAAEQPPTHSPLCVGEALRKRLRVDALVLNVPAPARPRIACRPSLREGGVARGRQARGLSLFPADGRVLS
jgi:hypothetical protein